MLNSSLQWIYFLPIAVIAIASISIPFVRQKNWAHTLSIAFVVTALLLSSYLMLGIEGQVFITLLVFDKLALAFSSLLLALGLAIFLLHREPQQQNQQFDSLILFSLLGMMILCHSQNLLLIFIALETMSVPLYALVAWPLQRNNMEAGLKYIVLAGVGAAFFLLGTSLYLLATGSFILASPLLTSPMAEGNSLLNHVALTLILIALAFKLAWVPFHLWLADIYQGSPSTIMLIIATMAKVAIVVFLIRLLIVEPLFTQISRDLLAGLAILTMSVGNLLALRQNNLRRLFAYSSIAHMGYLLVALASSEKLFVTAAIYYIFAYALMNLVTLGIIGLIRIKKQPVQTLGQITSLAYQAPVLALCLSINLLALAGIPPTAGFMAKFLAFNAAIQSDMVYLALIAIFNTALSFFYYLRVIIKIYTKGDCNCDSAAWFLQGIFVLISLAMLVIGIFPQFITGQHW